jgi:small-conductance mechanosensitive channel
MKGEDISVEVDGVVQSVSTSVTLGVLLRAVIFFVIGYWVLSMLSNRIQGTIIRRGHIAEAQARTLRNWAMIIVGVGLAITTLSLLKIPLTIFAFFGGALAIGLGFGSQTLIKNFICGIIVLFERKIRVGDVVDVGGVTGSITEINTRSSVLSSPDGRETLVPNSVFLETSITNLTLANRTLRRFINIGVAYGTPPGKVSKILSECAERHGLIHKDPAPLVIFQDFGDNALVFKLYFWVALDGKTNPELVESDIRIMIEKSFTENGIAFPFPQRDMHLKTDVPIQVSMTPPTPAAEPDRA